MHNRESARFGSVIVVLAMVLLGCSNAPETDNRAEKTPVVLASFSVLGDLAANVADEHLWVESFVPAGSEVHTYEPTPGDIRRVDEADLILTNGLGLETGLDQYLATSDAPRAELSQGVADLGIAEDGGINPHAWMSPTMAWIYVDNIVAAFSDLDPDNAQAYRDNGEAYKQRLYDAQNELITGLSTLPADQRVLVTCEGSLAYLARDNGLESRSLWSTVGVEPTPQVMTETIEFVRQRQVPAVFCESTINDGPMRRVATDSGAVLGDVLYADSLSATDGPVPTYIDLIRRDAQAIVAGLTGTPAP